MKLEYNWTAEPLSHSASLLTAAAPEEARTHVEVARTSSAQFGNELWLERIGELESKLN